MHETLLAATPSLLPPPSSSPCRRSTICTSRSSAIDPVQPLTAYAGTINEETARLDSDLLLVPLASDFLIEVSLDPLAPRLANAYTIGARRAQLVHASRPLNESINTNYYYVISQLFELQEPDAGFMLAVGLDFGKQSRSQLRLPLAQSRGFVTSGHTASDATARQSSRANAESKTSPRQALTARP